MDKRLSRPLFNTDNIKPIFSEVQMVFDEDNSQYVIKMTAKELFKLYKESCVFVSITEEGDDDDGHWCEVEHNLIVSALYNDGNNLTKYYEFHLADARVAEADSDDAFPTVSI